MMATKKLVNAFRFSFAGIAEAFKTQLNFRIEVFAAAGVTGAGFYFKVSPAEWMVIVLSCAMVLAAELFNTAIEKSCDLFTKEFHPAIKFIKDIAAAAVLVLSIAAAICGTIIFLPKIIQLFN